MFMVKHLLGGLWADTNAAELAKIPSGEFFIARPRSSLKGQNECLFINAMATIRRSSSEFQYQLVIQRVIEEGEGEILDEDEESDDELTFLLDESLEFRELVEEGQHSFLWRDLDGDEDDLYQFVVMDSSKRVSDIFLMAALKAMYERKYRKPSDNIKDAELKKLLWRPPTASSSGRPSPTVLKSTAQSRQLARASAKEPEVPIPQALPPVNQIQESSLTAESSQSQFSPVEAAEIDGQVLAAANGELLRFDFTEDGFLLEADPILIQIVRGASGPFDYWLVAREDDATWLCHELTSSLNCKWSKSNLAFRWNHTSKSGHFGAWCVRFKEEPAYTAFREAVGRALFENNHQISWEKANQEETAYARDTYVDNDVEMKELYENDEDEEDAVADELESEYEDAESENQEEEEEEEDEFHDDITSGTNDRNSLLAVGYKNDRSFVVRGNRIGVFKNTDEDKVQFHTTINKINTTKGKQFTPKKMMLHNQDQSLILMNPNDPNSLYRMDLTYGKVVDEWKIDENVPVTHFAPRDKFAQTTGEQTLVGASHNGLYRIDPRLSGNKLVDSEFKQYKTKADFSAISTTGDGGVAVASAKGDIRLFDKVGKMAKTALPALGDPIVGVETSASGRWIVATCKTHLYVIDTLIGSGKFQGKLGFDRAFPADSRPIPKRLQLKPEHVAYMGEISFTPARFNVGENQEENTIVTSTGKYVVAWDFKKIKMGKLDKYEVKQYEDNVVADNFRFDKDKEIVVALTDNVLMLNKKTLRKPTRASLASPAQLGPSRSDIVNAPY